jgi:hypothetical protein
LARHNTRNDAGKYTDLEEDAAKLLLPPLKQIERSYS